jgi:disulfide bond formation protein DsbB
MTAATPRTLAWLNYGYLLLMMLVIAVILTTAMAMQYVGGELPCPLCLLQRVALFGVCFGIIATFRFGDSGRNSGLSLMFAIFLLVVSVRQSLLDIYPRPGHAYIGSAVFGIHMPVWCVLIALALLIAYALKLALLDGQRARTIPLSKFPVLARAARAAGAFVIALCAINLVSVVVQCGFDACHTSGYRLLQAVQ